MITKLYPQRNEEGDEAGLAKKLANIKFTSKTLVLL